MARSRMVVTGASGFLGRHLVEALRRDHEIVAVSRASPGSRGMALPAGVRWLYLDVADAPGLDEAMAQVRRGGPVQVLIHLAGHYDFSGERHPEYQRTNVEGTRHVLRVARALGVSDVVFASSVAACRFPGAGEALSESSPADGETPYAESKRAGEALLAASRGDFRGWIVRFAALFSDWCEYEPMFRFIETWLSRQPRHRVLAGRGASAVPYLHVRDAVDFVRALLARRRPSTPARPCSPAATARRRTGSSSTPPRPPTSGSERARSSYRVASAAPGSGCGTWRAGPSGSRPSSAPGWGASSTCSCGWTRPARASAWPGRRAHASASAAACPS